MATATVDLGSQDPCVRRRCAPKHALDTERALLPDVSVHWGIPDRTVVARRVLLRVRQTGAAQMDPVYLATQSVPTPAPSTASAPRLAVSALTASLETTAL